MSGSIVAFPSASVPKRPARPAITERLLRAVDYLVREWRIRRDLAQLQTMDARALRDVGLTRGGLEGAVRHGRRAAFTLGMVPEGMCEAPEPPRIPASWTEWR